MPARFSDLRLFPLPVFLTFLAFLLLSSTGFSQKLSTDKPSERMRFFYEQRAFPNGIPAGARRVAIEQLDARRRAAIKAGSIRAAEGNPWKLIGPQPTNQPGSPLYQVAGRVTAFAIDPRDNNVAYLGAADGGVWKTRDGGSTWIPLTDDQPSLSTGAIAIDPKNPDIVYVGTGEQNNAGDSFYGAGILKSSDGGQTWKNIVGPFNRLKIGALAIHPDDTNVILAGSSAGGVFRSDDAGETWTNVLGTVQASSIVFHPQNHNTVYAGLGRAQVSTRNGIYRSDDGGLTWKLSGTSGLPSANIGRITLAVTAAAPNNLYAAFADGSSARIGANLGVFRSTDQGTTWQQLTSVPEYCSSQCWYAMEIKVHPTNPDVIFLGGLNILRSLDGGITWRVLGAGTNRVNYHVDQHVFTFTNDGHRLYVGNDGGVWSTDEADQTSLNWAQLNQSLSITQFYSGMSLHPTDPNITLAGAQDNGTQSYTGINGWDNITCGDGGWTGIDQASPNIRYATCQNIDIRRNGGLGPVLTWLNFENGIAQEDTVAFIPPFVVDQVNSQRVYFGTFRLWQSRDAAGNWAAISPNLTFGAGATLSTIAVAQSDPNVIYTGARDGRVMVTANAGDGAGKVNWTDRSSGLPGRAVTRVVVDPFDAGTAYVTFSGFAVTGEVRPGHVYKTTDGGATWSNASGNLPNLPVNDLVVDPDLPDTLYIGTDAGVMVSRDAGATWSEAGFGLPRSFVLSLALHRPSRTLRAATHGRSVWDLSIPATVSRPVIDSLTPPTVKAGAGDMQLTIKGSNFGPGSQVLWNGTKRTVSSGTNAELVIDVPSSDVQGVGRASIVVFNPSLGGGASIPMKFVIGEAPLIVEGALGNSAIPGPGMVSPGSIVTLYGLNFAPELKEQTPSAILPYVLDGCAVIISGVAAPLYFVSPGQLSFQMPWTANSNANFSVSVVQGDQISGTINLRTAPFAPGLFATNRAGSGQGSIRIAGLATIAAPVGAFPDSRPAKRGEVIEVYGTGFGAVTNRPGTGLPSSTTTLSRTLTDPTATIGSKNATVTFSGLAPGTVGLYQINLQVPLTADVGDAVPLQITIGGVASNMVTVAVAP
ncbi:MAG: IPT/TIG domain-containing protein [Bryobacteraceae bacterium]